MDMSNVRAKSAISVVALILVSLSLSTGLTASAEDREKEGDKGTSAQSKEFKSDQPNFSNNREQTLESGMEPVIVQPSRADNGALVQPGKAALYSAAPDLSNIVYRLGAPVMPGPITIYEVWYGSWNPTSTSTPVAKAYQTFTNEFLTAAVAPSQHWAINKLNYQAAKATPATRTPVGDYSTNIQQRIVAANTVKYKSPLSQSSIYSIARDTFFPAVGAKADPNGIYVVLTSSDIKVNGFGTSFCGWHSYNATSLAKYSFVGDPASTPGCLAQSVGPNLAGADSMISVLMHELEETATDPQLNAWYSANGNENGDKCAWTWGATTLNSNGSYSNMTLGSKNYLIQQNFKLSGTAPVSSSATTHTWSGTCAIK
jgi:hypothetical protein